MTNRISDRMQNVHDFTWNTINWVVARGDTLAPTARLGSVDPLPELAESETYKLIEEIGRGSMGVVYLVWNRVASRLEVMKVLDQRLAERYGESRLLHEVQLLAGIHHRNIINAYEFVQIGDLSCYTMEFVQGFDLASIIDRNGPLPVSHAADYVRQAAAGLAHLHACGIVHRDIKPRNLLLARDADRPVVKILDFGLAETVHGTRSKSPSDGMMLGTPGYWAPEQIENPANLDVRSDIYSLGCSLYFLLSAKQPFAGKDLFSSIEATVNQEARPLLELRPDAPEGLAAVAARMMAKNPEQRFQTAEGVVQALTPFTGELWSAAVADSSKGLAANGFRKYYIKVFNYLFGSVNLGRRLPLPQRTPSMPEDKSPYETLIAEHEDKRRAMEREFAAKLLPALKEEMVKRPHDTYPEMLELVRWLNGELRNQNLSIRSPVTQRPATLVADLNGKKGRFKIKGEDEAGKMITVNIPSFDGFIEKFDIVETPPRREPLREWRARVGQKNDVNEVS